MSTHNLVYAKEALLQGECLFCKDQYFHDLFGDSFYVLERAGYISSTLRQSLVAMIGFRNIAIHQYLVLVPYL